MNTTSNGPAAASQEVWQRPFVKQHQQWCDDFVLELRMHDVAGPVIGERLAEVEAHCAETGASPSEAFGDPAEYARLLDEQVESELMPGAWRVAVIAAVKVLALIVGTSAAGSWARGEQLSYNVVQLGGLAVLVTVALSLPLLVAPLLRWPWRVGFPLLLLGILAAVGAAAAGRLDLPTVLDLAPSGATIGLFLLVLVLTWAEYRELSRDVEGDLVTSPLAPTPDAPPRSRRWMVLLPVLLIPVAYVVLSAVAWLFA